MPAKPANTDRVTEIYEDLKLRDRVSPGRTPWQTLKARAEVIEAAEREATAEAFEPTDDDLRDGDFLNETPAEELGRLRRELSEHDAETPEHRDILDRIAVLVREASIERRAELAEKDVAESIAARQTSEEYTATVEERVEKLMVETKLLAGIMRDRGDGVRAMDLDEAVSYLEASIS